MIQSCSLKNHSARNSPGRQRQPRLLVVKKEGFRQTAGLHAALLSPHGILTSERSLCCLSPLQHARFLSTPRLPVASYKNSFSMTEWRIRLEGSGRSSGTPFKDVCPALFCSAPLSVPPCVEKKRPKLLLNLSRNYEECCSVFLLLLIQLIHRSSLELSKLHRIPLCWISLVWTGHV